MELKRFKLWNRIGGWAVFAIAATVYLLTIEPKATRTKPESPNESLAL